MAVIAGAIFGITRMTFGAEKHSDPSTSRTYSNSDGNCYTYVTVTGPSGTSTMKISYACSAAGASVTGGSFIKKAHNVKLSSSITSSGNPYNLKLGQTSVNTMLNANEDSNYTVMHFKVTYTLPAHENYKSQADDATYANHVLSTSSSSHSTSSQTTTLNISVSIYAAGISNKARNDSPTGRRRYYGSTLTVTNEKKNYKLTYNANGGTCGSTSKNIACGGTYGELPTAMRAGYSFVGWNTSSTATTSNVTSSTTLCNGNKTIYAVWKEKTFKVNFHGNGSSGAAYSTEFSANKNNSLPTNAFTRPGYNFLGWSTNKDDVEVTYKNGASIVPLSDGGTLNLYAVWRKSNADFDTNNIIHDDKMFLGDVYLEGGNGTGYNNSKTDSEYARIDRTGIQGYFTNRW